MLGACNSSNRRVFDSTSKIEGTSMFPWVTPGPNASSRTTNSIRAYVNSKENNDKFVSVYKC